MVALGALLAEKAGEAEGDLVVNWCADRIDVTGRVQDHLRVVLGHVNRVVLGFDTRRNVDAVYFVDGEDPEKVLQPGEPEVVEHRHATVVVVVEDLVLRHGREHVLLKGPEKAAVLVDL